MTKLDRLRWLLQTTEIEEDEPDPTDEDDDGPEDDGPKVVSLDQFRKK